MVTSGVFCGVVKILEKASQELRKREFSWKNEKSFRNVHGPGLDGACASSWYGPLRVQKLTLSVFNDVKSPGQFFHEWDFLDNIAPIS